MKYRPEIYIQRNTKYWTGYWQYQDSLSAPLQPNPIKPDAREVGMQKFNEAMRPRDITATQLQSRASKILDRSKETALVNGRKATISTQSFTLPFTVDSNPLYARLAQFHDERPTAKNRSEIIISATNTPADITTIAKVGR